MKQKKYGPEFFDKEYFLAGTKSNYNESYFNWELMGENYLRVAGEIINKFNAKKILDVGCALGMLVKALRECGADAHGIDISNWAIENGFGNCQVCDLTKDKIPFEDNHFDLVICFDVLEHLPFEFHEFVFSEISRVCSKNLFISQPFIVLPKQIYGKMPIDDESHISLMPPYYYIYEFIRKGFKLKEMYRIKGANPWDMRLIFSR